MKSLTINIGQHETDPMKERILEGFGKRLVSIRKSRGITQTELGSRVGVSKRVIAYYEDENAQPPGAMLVDLAHALSVSTDELLGVKPSRTLDPNSARILKRVRKIEALPRQTAALSSSSSMRCFRAASLSRVLLLRGRLPPLRRCAKSPENADSSPRLKKRILPAPASDRCRFRAEFYVALSAGFDAAGCSVLCAALAAFLLPGRAPSGLPARI